MLNYFGQGALLIADPHAIESPFFNLAPEWAVVPLAVLATMATVIASQALISGAFSLTVQAVQLDYLPRLKIRHTSSSHRGQVYVPLVNWLLMVGCIGLVLDVPLVQQPGRRVRHRRHHHDGDHHAAVLRRVPPTGGSGRRRKALLVTVPAAGHRPGLPRRQHREDPARRLVPAAGRRSAC